MLYHPTVVPRVARFAVAEVELPWDVTRWRHFSLNPLCFFVGLCAGETA